MLLLALRLATFLAGLLPGLFAARASRMLSTRFGYVRPARRARSRARRLLAVDSVLVGRFLTLAGIGRFHGAALRGLFLLGLAMPEKQHDACLRGVLTAR